MPRNFFSTSSSRQARPPVLPEHVSSSPPQEMSSSPPSNGASTSDAVDAFLKLPLPGSSPPSMKSKSDISLPGKKGAWKSISNMMSRNHSSTQVSTASSNGSPIERPSSPVATIDNEKELHISPPSTPTRGRSTSRSRKTKHKARGKLSSYRRKEKHCEPVHKIEALEGESIASRFNIGTASIDCELYKIEYGQFKERPACLIIVDVRLVYPPDNTIDRVKLELQFAKDDLQSLSPERLDCIQNTKTPISKVFAPEVLEGRPWLSQKTTHHNIMPKIEGMSFKLDTGGGGSQTISNKENRWLVLGRREEHDGIYDTFGWNIFQNEASDDSVPRQFRLGMIVFHEHQPFSVNVNIKGSTRQKFRRPKAAQEKRWFQPPKSEDVGRHVLQEAMVDNLVSKQNLLIRDIAPSRATERTTLNLIDIAGNSGGVGSGIDGVGMITDLLSMESDGLIADSPTTVMGSGPCN